MPPTATLTFGASKENPSTPGSLPAAATVVALPHPPTATPADDPFAHGGRAGEILRGLDWARKPIGPVSAWPQSLRTALSICLSSRHPICIIWGRDRLYLYNDAYAPIVGAKHPWALGESYITVWPEIWESSIRPILETVERTGEASWCDDLLLVLQRRGFNEECYFSFSFAPTRVEDGSVGGVFTAITETTPQVVGERRLRTLRDLAAQASSAKTPDEACRLAAGVLASNPHDVPFALFYLVAPNGRSAQLVRDFGLEDVPLAKPAELSLAPGAAGVWPLHEALARGAPVLVSALAPHLGPLPGGPWPDPTHQALVLPIARAGQAAPHGFIVAGLSPRRVLDDDYRSFLQLAANQVAAAVSNAEAYAEARRRAEALAEIDRAKTAFFSNVSHEFRTPLTLMLGPLEELLARPEALPAAARAQIETTHRNSLRLLKLVNSLLDFSRIEAGRVQAAREPIDLGTSTAELAAVFRAAIENAGLRLLVNCPASPRPAYVDHDMWEKIVFNLLSNAFKFTLEGEIEVRLTETDGYAELSVRDTGVGIPEAELPNVFTRFHRIANIRSRTHEGTGIGLALAQELAKLHGGSIAVQSRLGEGTTFLVTLPTRPTAADATPPRVPCTSLPAWRAADAFIEEIVHILPDAVDGRATSGAAVDSPAQAAPLPVAPAAATKPRILFADDNADMRAYVQRLLADTFTVELAPDGEAALAAIERCPPDLVLADVMMPRLDGFGLLRGLRERSAHRTLPVILLSARAGQEASVEGYEAGADDYLIKPFSARELRTRIETHLRLARLRQEAAKAVEVERKRMHELLMAAPAMICALRGPEHVFELANPPYVELAGRRDAHELIGKPVREALPEVAGQGYFEILDRVYTTGEPYVGKEMKVQVADPQSGGLKEKVLNFLYQPTRDLAGRIDGILVHAVEITEQVHARQLVEELAVRLETERDRSRTSEQHLRAVLDATAECVKIVGADCTVLEMNPAGIAMLEADRDDAVLGRNVCDLIAPEHREGFRRFNASVCQGAKGTLELDFVGLRGSRRHMETHAVPLRLADGRRVQLAFSRDITDRRRAEAAMRASEARFRAFVTASSDVVYTANADWSELLGVEGRDFIANTSQPTPDWLEQYIPAEERGRVLRAIEVARQGKTMFELEHLVNRVDGSRGWVHSRAVPILDDRGDITQWFGAARDVTEMVRARETVAERRQELERLVDERTAKLQQAVEQMEEFSYSVSHDLRSPVRAMAGYAEVLLDEYGSRLDERGRDFLARIKRSSARMDQLIRDLLTYSRISRREIYLERVSMERLVHEVVAQYPELRPERADLELITALPEVLGHEPSLSQALSNLLTNAVKFVAPGTRPRVRLRADRVGGQVRLWIEDNGIGIPPEHHRRLFGLFERVHPQFNYEGTGIGLAIVRKAVERMNGSVGVESDGTGGSRFWIELPPAPGA